VSAAAATAILLHVVSIGCARTDLNPGEIETGESREPNLVDPDAAPPDADVEDAEPDADVEDAEPDADVEDAEPDACEPTGAEVCNGVDDDCNGQVDDLAPVACPEGGFSYCVRGAMSECPRECQTCMPGSETICFVSYCYFWGVQTCAGDGKSLSGCIEEPPPSACADIARDHQRSRQLEQCCIDQGHCCKDDFDLDHDGDTRDYVGTCTEVICGDD
jgi:hypothetical protein